MLLNRQLCVPDKMLIKESMVFYLTSVDKRNNYLTSQRT